MARRSLQPGQKFIHLGYNVRQRRIIWQRCDLPASLPHQDFEILLHRSGKAIAERRIWYRALFHNCRNPAMVSAILTDFVRTVPFSWIE